ncbi:concanavalin A-like lectin/glucanase superfamily protein [Promicromonospora sp. AC04]|nr:concanavalin A-like lectin/glucanase superfamily protein [Promicromonospora sp. AC04]
MAATAWVRAARGIRSRAGGVVAAVTALVVLASGASALVATGAADGVLSAMSLDDEPVLDCPVEEPSMSEALATAARCGHEVEALDEKSPWQAYFGQPSGQVRLEIGSSADASDADGDGTFEPIETAVAEDEAGRLSPAAPAVAMSFSAGGNDADTEPDVLARMTSADGQVVDVEAPFELTDPVVEGNRIVYPDVMSTGGEPSGVDLVVAVNADGSGFSQVLRIADEAAARNPQVTDLDADLGLGVSAKDATGADLDVAREHGAFTVTDPDAAELDADGGDPEVFRSSRPLIWTSEEPADQAASATADVERAASSDIEASPSASTASGQTDPLAGPLTPDAVVELPTDGGEGAEDDAVGAAIETAAEDESTAFPMFAALAVSGTLSEVTAVRSAWPDSASSYQFDGDAGVGRCLAPDPYAGYQCGLSSTHRVLYEFGGLGGVGSLASSDVTKAVFNINATFSYNCDKTGVWVYQAGSNAVSNATTWNNRGSWSTRLASALVTHRSDCAGMVRSVGFDVTAGAKKVASSNWSSLTLGVRSANESTMVGWKRYIGRNDGNGSTSPRATLSVTYNRAPGIPSSLTTWHSKEDYSCKTGTDRPVLRTTMPRLSAFIRDPDGNATKARFQIWRVTSDIQVWGAYMSSYLPSARTHKIQVPDNELFSNVVYKWRVLAKDSSGREGSWSKWCEFTVDITKPEIPNIYPVTSGAGVEAVYTNENIEAGGIGLTGKFRFGWAGSTDVVRFQYGFTDPATPKAVPTSSTGTAVVSFTPTKPGPATVYVRSVDRAGNISDPRAYFIDIAAPQESHIWRMDEGTGTSVADGAWVTVKEPLTIKDDGVGTAPTWTAGPHELFGSRVGDKAISLDGVDDRAATVAAGIDTTKSFVVSAHVRLPQDADLTGHDVAISQNGTVLSPFALMWWGSCRADGGCWSFNLYQTDAAGSGIVRATQSSAVTYTPGEWVHLTGAWNEDTGKASLWVCPIGTPEKPAPANPIRSDSTATISSMWRATGATVIGRGKSNGESAHFFDGEIDNVRVFEGTVIAENKVRRLCQGADSTDFLTGIPALDPTVGDKSVEESGQ